MIRACAFALAGLLPALSFGAGALGVKAAVVQEFEDGPPVYKPQGLIPGEAVHFSFLVENFTNKENHVELSFTARPLDAKGVPLAPEVTGRIDTKLSPEDKDWMPKLRGMFDLPPILLPGEYKIQIELTDGLSHARASKEIAYLVSAVPVQPSESLKVRDLSFYANEDSPKPLETAAYRGVESIHARFNLIGYQHTTQGKIDVAYGIVLSDVNGRVLYQENPAARDETESFYPKPYIPGSLALNLKPGTPPGEYTLTIKAFDAIGKQQTESRSSFKLE